MVLEKLFQGLYTDFFCIFCQSLHTSFFFSGREGGKSLSFLGWHHMWVITYYYKFNALLRRWPGNIWDWEILWKTWTTKCDLNTVVMQVYQDYTTARMFFPGYITNIFRTSFQYISSPRLQLTLFNGDKKAANDSCPWKNHKHEKKEGAQLKTSFWHLLMNLKNK